MAGCIVMYLVVAKGRFRGKGMAAWRDREAQLSIKKKDNRSGRKCGVVQRGRMAERKRQLRKGETGHQNAMAKGSSPGNTASRNTGANGY